MSDPLLRPFFEAETEARADAALGNLLADVADPVIRRMLGRKFRRPLAPGHPARDQESLDAEDAVSATHALLVRRLYALRGEPAATREPVRNFAALVTSLAFTAWVEHLRDRHPARARLFSQMRYLLVTRGDRTGFAAWPDDEGEPLCGFVAWRDRGAAAAPDTKVQEFLADPGAVVRDAIPLGELRTAPPARLLAVIFDRLGAPLRLEDLHAALAELWDVSAQREAAPPRVLEELPASVPTPADAARWNEYLAWLWRALGALSPRQRAAFLLNSGVIREFEHSGVADFPALAGALGVPAGEFARLWRELPLSDQAIADRLGIARQQVINLRRAARVLLGRELAILLGDAPPPRAPQPS